MKLPSRTFDTKRAYCVVLARTEGMSSQTGERSVAGVVPLARVAMKGADRSAFPPPVAGLSVSSPPVRITLAAEPGEVVDGLVVVDFVLTKSVRNAAAALDAANLAIA